MRKRNHHLFSKTSLLVAGFLLSLGCLFIGITYLATLHYYQATTQRLNKDVAWHIAKFTSPYEPRGLNREIADSIFFDAMVLSPSVEVYFLDTTGQVLYYHAPDSAIRQRKVPLAPLKRYIASGGLEYIKATDPKRPDDDKVFSAAEVISDGHRRGYIYVILGGNEYQTISQLLFGNHITSLALQAMAVVVILSVVVSGLFLARIKKNLAKITGVLTAYQKGDYTARFNETGYNEFTPIAESFNQMADLLTYNIARLQQSEKSRKDFIANISHDLRTPLTVVRGYVETWQEESLNGATSAGRQVEITALIYKKLEQLELMIIQLFELTKMESIGFTLSREPFNIAELIEEMVNGLQKTAVQKQVVLSSTGSSSKAWIRADIALIERVLQNLLDNAIRNTAENGTIQVLLKKHPEKNITIAITNTKAALSPELLAWINSDEIQPEYRSAARRGLGLAIVKKILQLHGYRLHAYMERDQVCIEIELEAFQVPGDTERMPLFYKDF